MESPSSSPKSRFSVQPAAGASSILLSSQTTLPCPHDRWWSSVSRMSGSSGNAGFGVLPLLILSLLTTHASATLITSFMNCLPEDVQQSPTHLQFHPLAVDAIFDVSIFPYTLNITVYGNVTGRSSANPPGTKRWLSDFAAHSIGGEDGELVSGQYDDDRVRNARRHGTGFIESVEDPTAKHQIFAEGVQQELDQRIYKRSDIQYETGGSILQQDPAWNNDKQTTLQSKVNVLTFQLYNGLVPFCSNAHCPMQPVTSLRFVVMGNSMKLCFGILIFDQRQRSLIPAESSIIHGFHSAQRYICSD